MSLKPQHHYFKELPHNLNWAYNRRLKLIKKHFQPLTPVTLLDVGARWGIPEELAPIKSYVSKIGFDADLEACQNLDATDHGLFASETFPIFVGGEDGKVEFNLYDDRSASSQLEPNNRYLRLFGSNLRIEKKIKVDSITIDSFYQKKPNLRNPNIIKIDTQGTELAVLKGAVNALKRVGMVDVEVQFTPQYENAATFDEIFSFMHNNGFELLYLNRVTQQRERSSFFSKGQLVFGDAIFGHREDKLDAFSQEDLLNYILLLSVYGFFDIASGLIGKVNCSDSRMFLEEIFTRRVKDKILENSQRYLNPIIDKIILLLLSFRKHNSLFLDSDRSWPTR